MKFYATFDDDEQLEAVADLLQLNFKEIIALRNECKAIDITQVMVIELCDIFEHYYNDPPPSAFQKKCLPHLAMQQTTGIFAQWTKIL